MSLRWLTRATKRNEYRLHGAEVSVVGLVSSDVEWLEKVLAMWVSLSSDDSELAFSHHSRRSLYPRLGTFALQPSALNDGW
jgi:hypothetical protein